MSKKTTRRLHRELCGNLPHPEDNEFHVYTSGPMNVFALHIMVLAVFRQLFNYFRRAGKSPMVAIGGMMRLGLVDKSVKFDVDPIVKGASLLLDGTKDWLLFAVVCRDFEEDNHAMLYAVRRTESNTLVFSLLDPNGRQGYTDWEYGIIHELTRSVFPKSVHTIFKNVMLPPMNDVMDAELRRKDEKHGFTNLRMWEHGFCTYWVYAYVVDICCTRKRVAEANHFQRLLDRASGPYNTSTQRHNRLMYLRAVMTWIIDDMRAAPAPRVDVTRVVALFNEKTVFQKKRSPLRRIKSVRFRR